MNNQTLANNLRNTIAGKQASLDRLDQRKGVKRDFYDAVAYFSAVGFLKTSIAELESILKDVEQYSK